MIIKKFENKMGIEHNVSNLVSVYGNDLGTPLEDT